MIDQVAAATRQLPAGTSAEEALRASITAFLGFLAAEPAFARAFYIDMPAAGPRAVQRIEDAQNNFARLNRAWHERARRDHPDWPAVPYQAYYALAGATTELIREEVRQDKIGSLPGLADTLAALHLAVLAGQSGWSRRARSCQARFRRAKLCCASSIRWTARGPAAGMSM